MRDAPYVRLAREIVDRGGIGELLDLEVRMTVDTPWHLWSFLNDIPRMEILYHSIHYVDLIRSFYGEPRGVWARTIGHPRMPRIRQVRSTIAMDYGERRRATITTNHTHAYGPRYQESTVKWEGTEGAIRITAGLNLDYPHGRPDTFEVYTTETGVWQTVPLQGSWFPHAFMGPMASLMRFVEGSTDVLPTSVDDAYRTMATVEAAYRANARGGEPIPTEP
jgi:predicted dehydrogenase